MATSFKGSVKPRLDPLVSGCSVGIETADLALRLKRMGHEVPATVTAVDAAPKTTKSVRPDVVIMDIMLAGTMTGIEVASLIRSGLDVSVCVCVLTARSESHTLGSALMAEPHAYIVNPYDEANLRASIE